MKETFIMQRIFILFVIFNIGKGQKASESSKNSIAVIRDAPLAGFIHTSKHDLNDFHGETTTSTTPTTTTSTTTTTKEPTTTTTTTTTTSAPIKTSTKAIPSVTPKTTRTSTTQKPLTYRPYPTYGHLSNEYKHYNNEPGDDTPKYDSNEPLNPDEGEDGYEDEDEDEDE